MLGNLFHTSGTRPFARHRPSRSRFRPALEGLDERCVPAVYDWTGGATFPAGSVGNFNLGGNWINTATGVVGLPGPTDDVTITGGFGAPPPAVVVTASIRVNSLFLSPLGTAVLVDGGTLTVLNFFPTLPTMLPTAIIDSGASLVLAPGPMPSVGFLSVEGGGTFQVSGGAADIMSSSMIAGNLNVLGGAVLFFDGGTFNSLAGGSALLGAGKYFVNPGATLEVDGDSTVSNLVNYGTVDVGTPGTDVAVLTISGSFTQTATGISHLTFAGTAAGDYSRIDATGHRVRLDGKLIIDYLAPFAPVAGNSFTVLTYGSRRGSVFAMISSSSPPAIPAVGIVYGASALTITY